MITVDSSVRTRNCQGTHRRDFLRVGSLAIGGLTLPDLLRARAAAATSAGGLDSSGQPSRTAVKDTSVVLLWLSGGPTHVETFDPKMTAPSEYRSTVGAIDTAIPGVQIGGLLPGIAQNADKMAFVRSFAHRNSGHGGGTHFVMTGYDNRGSDQGMPANKPSYGSIAAKFRGPSNARTGVPTYVRLGGINADGPAFLGKAHAPFETSGTAKNNMSQLHSDARMADRRSLLAGLDRINRQVDNSGLMAGFDAYEQQAYSLIMGGAKTAFDVNSEPKRLRDRYGDGLGLQLLQARRLCEAGCGFVTINYGGWDMHSNIVNSMRQRGPALDRAVAAFVSDVAERGLSENICLVITGEFGRTPRVNRNSGRDHWAPLSTLAFAGGGLRMGQVVGESTAKAEVPQSTPIGPQDLMATLFHVLGLPQDLHFQDMSGRPVPMISGGRPIAELV